MVSKRAPKAWAFPAGGVQGGQCGISWTRHNSKLVQAELDALGCGFAGRRTTRTPPCRRSSRPSPRDITCLGDRQATLPQVVWT